MYCSWLVLFACTNDISPYVRQVVDLNTGEKVGPGQRGEIRVKGPCCSRGYINNPEATKELYDNEGFLKCGMVNDHGFLFSVTFRQRLGHCCHSVCVTCFKNLYVQVSF